MENERKLLKAAAIIDCIFGALTSSIYIGIPIIIIGLYLYAESKVTDEELIRNKGIYRIIGILSFVNIISFAILLTCYDNIKKYEEKVNGINAPPKKIIYKQDPESKKIDMLLKLGVGMIFISGILFATTTWSFINNYVKAFALIFLGSLFILLSIFTEKKLKLYNSSYMYWLLGISFFILTIVGILYFEIFGNYLTYTGSGSKLAYAITLLSTSGLLFATYLKFPKKYLANISLFSALISIYNIILYISKSINLSICMVTAIVTVLNMFNRKDNILSNFTKVISFSLLILSIDMTYNDPKYLFLASIINIINFNYQSILENNKDIPVINMIVTEVLMLISGLKLEITSNLNYSLIILLTSIYTILINTNIIKSNDKVKLANFVSYSIISLILINSSAASMMFKDNYNMVLISLIYLLVFTITKNGLFKSFKIEKLKYIEPLVLLITISSGTLTFIKDVGLSYIIAIVSFLYIVISILNKDKEIEKLYLIYSIIGTSVITLNNSPIENDLIISLLNIINALLIFSKIYIKQEYPKGIRIYSYIVLLLSLYTPIVLQNILNIPTPIITISYIIVVYLIAILLKQKYINIITNFIVLIPLLHLIKYFNFDYAINSIVVSLTLIYSTILVIKYFIKQEQTKNIVLIIGLILFLLEPLLIESIYGGVYVGIIAIIAIIYGFLKEERSSIFTTGIIITIINIAYRLRSLWKLLPFWLYLLLGGLIIIGFVTYREIKKK